MDEDLARFYRLVGDGPNFCPTQADDIVAVYDKAYNGFIKWFYGAEATPVYAKTSSAEKPPDVSYTDRISTQRGERARKVYSQAHSQPDDEYFHVPQILGYTIQQDLSPDVKDTRYHLMYARLIQLIEEWYDAENGVGSYAQLTLEEMGLTPNAFEIADWLSLDHEKLRTEAQLPIFSVPPLPPRHDPAYEVMRKARVSAMIEVHDDHAYQRKKHIPLNRYLLSRASAECLPNTEMEPIITVSQILYYARYIAKEMPFLSVFAVFGKWIERYAWNEQAQKYKSPVRVKNKTAVIVYTDSHFLKRCEVVWESVFHYIKFRSLYRYQAGLLHVINEVGVFLFSDPTHNILRLKKAIGSLIVRVSELDKPSLNELLPGVEPFPASTAHYHVQYQCNEEMLRRIANARVREFPEYITCHDCGLPSSLQTFLYREVKHAIKMPIELLLDLKLPWVEKIVMTILLDRPNVIGMHFAQFMLQAMALTGYTHPDDVITMHQTVVESRETNDTYFNALEQARNEKPHLRSRNQEQLVENVDRVLTYIRESSRDLTMQAFLSGQYISVYDDLFTQLLSNNIPSGTSATGALTLKLKLPDSDEKPQTMLNARGNTRGFVPQARLTEGEDAVLVNRVNNVMVDSDTVIQCSLRKKGMFMLVFGKHTFHVPYHFYESESVDQWADRITDETFKLWKSMRLTDRWDPHRFLPISEFLRQNITASRTVPARVLRLVFPATVFIYVMQVACYPMVSYANNLPLELHERRNGARFQDTPLWPTPHASGMYSITESMDASFSNVAPFIIASTMPGILIQFSDYSNFDNRQDTRTVGNAKYHGIREAFHALSGIINEGEFTEPFMTYTDAHGEQHPMNRYDMLNHLARVSARDVRVIGSSFTPRYEVEYGGRASGDLDTFLSNSVVNVSVMRLVYEKIALRYPSTRLVAWLVAGDDIVSMISIPQFDPIPGLKYAAKTLDHITRDLNLELAAHKSGESNKTAEFAKILVSRGMFMRIGPTLFFSSERPATTDNIVERIRGMAQRAMTISMRTPCYGLDFMQFTNYCLSLMFKVITQPKHIGVNNKHHQQFFIPVWNVLMAPTAVKGGIGASFAGVTNNEVPYFYYNSRWRNHLLKGVFVASVLEQPRKEDISSAITRIITSGAESGVAYSVTNMEGKEVSSAFAQASELVQPKYRILQEADEGKSTLVKLGATLPTGMGYEDLHHRFVKSSADQIALLANVTTPFSHRLIASLSTRVFSYATAREQLIKKTVLPQLQNVVVTQSDCTDDVGSGPLHGYASTSDTFYRLNRYCGVLPKVRTDTLDSLQPFQNILNVGAKYCEAPSAITAKSLRDTLLSVLDKHNESTHTVRILNATLQYMFGKIPHIDRLSAQVMKYTNIAQFSDALGVVGASPLATCDYESRVKNRFVTIGSLGRHQRMLTQAGFVCFLCHLAMTGQLSKFHASELTKMKAVGVTHSVAQMAGDPSIPHEYTGSSPLVENLSHNVVMENRTTVYTQEVR